MAKFLRVEHGGRAGRVGEFGERIGRVLERIRRERKQSFGLAGDVDPGAHPDAAPFAPRFRGQAGLDRVKQRYVDDADNETVQGVDPVDDSREAPDAARGRLRAAFQLRHELLKARSCERLAFQAFENLRKQHHALGIAIHP